MTREGYLKHKALIEAWGNGAELEFKSEDSHWVVLPFAPSFAADYEYRIKPEPLERWLVVWESGALYSIHLSEDAANRTAGSGKGWRVAHMKEIINE